MQALDADGVCGADDRGKVMRAAHGIHEHREVGLTPVEGALELRESLRCHRPTLLVSTSAAIVAGETRIYM
jgi:hypothetical protein